jgi:ribose/xylose/arabinose/galactoside ABC-type transport system permease subunit/ABC-type sugar transport system substrate-binding protein
MTEGPPTTMAPLAGRCLDLKSTLQRDRLFLLGAAVFGLMAVLAPHEFPTAQNLANILRAASTDALAAAGFTVVMICGQLDLSVGMTMTSGGVAVMFLQPALGWAGAVGAAALAGCLIGLFNGLLVTKGRINSFIVTLGTLTILQGLNRALLQGGSKSLDDVEAGMRAVAWLQPILPWSPRVLLIFLPIVLLEVALRQTRPGRNLYLIGGNRQTAWFAGLPTDAYVLGAFVLSGVSAALGGAFTAISQNTAMPNLGEKSLMLIVAAVIVGGTAMSGGRGSVLMSLVALVILNALTNGLSYLGAARSVKLIAHGAVLAAVIVIDAWRTTRQNRLRGQRRALLAERDDVEPEPARAETETSAVMQTSDKTLATVCVASVACVAIVAIYALFLHHERSHRAAPEPGLSPASAADVLALKASDGQRLIWIDTAPLQAPRRPADPARLPDDDPLRWYDYEYAGWNVQRLPLPPSPGTGPRGKKVVSLQYMDHPYWAGYGNGMKRLAALYGMDLLIMEAGNDNKVQADQVEQVIRMRPDLVILTPVDSNGVVPLLKRLHDEKIPVIASNLLPVDDGMKYVLTWTGPDDWGQFRMLAREFATRMNHEGGYCVVRHVAGTSCYNSRTWSAVSELKQIAPGMKCLDMQSTDLKTEETKTQVAAWLKKFGSDLKGIISADDSKAMVGIVEALKDAGRHDVVCVSAGSSRTGLAFIKENRLHAVTYQSAEGDGALPIEMAARWFRGEKIERPVYYLQKHIITAKDLDQFWPAQW